MSQTRFPSSEFLFNRAKQCRSMARALVDPMSRGRMIDLALGYEEIAKKLEEQDSSRPQEDAEPSKAATI